MAIPRDHTALCRILDHLKNRTRRSINEIAETLNLEEKTTLEIIDFLADYNFLVFDEKSGEVFLDPKIGKLIQE